LVKEFKGVYMRKIILICLAIIFLVLPVFAEINFEQIHETLQQIKTLTSKMERISDIYRFGHWTIHGNEQMYFKPFTIQEKETLKNDWIELKNEVEAFWATLPGE